jgi:dolichol-phosphate mannosyltransferase
VKKLSVIIPAFNEAATIERVLAALWDLEISEWSKEIIVVNDGSTDQTEEKLASWYDKIIYVKHPKNLGKGAAIQTGFKHVTGDVVIMQDADLEYDPHDFPVILTEFGKSPSRVVYGSRNINPARQGYPHYVLGVWILTKLVNVLYGANLTDVYTCYKAFPLSVVKNLDLVSRGFEIEAELTAKTLLSGIPIVEVPISYNPRSFAQGKKIGLADWFKGLLAIIRFRFDK